MLEHISAHHRMLVLSNTNAIHFDMVRQNYPWLRHFDHLVLSYEVKAMKPAPAIYHAAIERSGCPPEECFFTDDIAGVCGGRAQRRHRRRQFESCAQLRGELSARGDSLAMITDLVQIKVLGEKKRPENSAFAAI